MALRVFISYTHDNQEHMDQIWDLSERLRGDGVDCRIDQQEESPAEGWPQWCKHQIRDAGFVLVVCTETYLRRYEGEEEPGKGLGAQWEGYVSTQEIYEAAAKNTKFIPLVFSSADSNYIPVELRGPTYYDLGDAKSYDKLFRRMTAQPERKPAPVAQEVRRMVAPQGKSPSPQPPLAGTLSKQLFTVPLTENPFFTGREEVLEELKRTLDERGIAALTGLGGMGKTQTAAQYAHHHRQDYEAVLWVRAESQETLFSDLSQLAARLGLPERDAKEQSVIVEAVKLWLEEHEGWLLVLDNVEDFGVVRELARKASANGHHVVITTQSQAMGAIGRQKLSPMDRDQGAVLLLLRAGRVPEDLKGRGFSRAITGSHASWFGLQPRPGPKPELDDNNNEALYGMAEAVPLQSAEPKDAALAREISQEVGGLPLALDQAGAYLEETGTGLGDYLELLRKRGKELLERRGGLDSDHLSVAATYLTSLEKLAKQNPAAAELLQACAFLVPDAIPEEIFTEGAAAFGPVLQAAASDPITWDEAIAAAFKFSLIERNPGKLLAVHRMVQAVAKWRMSDEERAQWAERVVGAVNAAFPYIEFAVWDKCERLVPSAQVCAALVDEYSLSFPEAARLLSQAAYYLTERARYAEAKPLMRRALAIDENAYGPDHPDVAIRLNNLAQLLKATNRLGEAESLMRQALAIDEKSYGPDHPAVARDLNNLAQLLQDTNRLGEAEPLYRRALAIWEKALGADHPQVGTGLNNLAQLLQDTNRLDEAEPLMRRALVIDERAYGPDHPNVAIRLNNLAQLLKATNRLGEAEPLMRRALEIDERSYGPDHPDVARDLNNLAQLLQATNRLGEAEPLMRQAVSIFEKAYGPDHPNVATSLNNLARLLQDTNRLGEAEPLMRRALVIDEKSFGPDHPNVAIDLNNLAALLRVTNRLGEAEPLMRQALTIFDKSLGRDHPSTVTVRGNLTGLLRELGRDEEADKL